MRLPFSLRTNPGSESEYLGPFEGVTESMRVPLVTWLHSSLNYLEAFMSETSMLNEFQTRLRFDFLPGSSTLSRRQNFVAEIVSSEDKFLDSIDLALELIPRDHNIHSIVGELNKILEHSSSNLIARKDANDFYGLEKRTSDALRTSFESATKSGNSPAHHLKLAWDSLYGKNPNFDLSYSESIKAIEASLIPLVSPNDSAPTITKMRNAIFDKPSKWVFAIGTPTSVVSLLSEVYENQASRHGRDYIPEAQNFDEAASIFQVALLVAELISNGCFRLSDSSS